MSFFATCMYLRGNLRAAWPPNASLYASSTCVHLRLLVGPFDQGLKPQLTGHLYLATEPTFWSSLPRELFPIVSFTTGGPDVVCDLHT